MSDELVRAMSRIGHASQREGVESRSRSGSNSSQGGRATEELGSVDARHIADLTAGIIGAPGGAGLHVAPVPSAAEGVSVVPPSVVPPSPSSSPSSAATATTLASPSTTMSPLSNVTSSISVSGATVSASAAVPVAAAVPLDLPAIRELPPIKLGKTAKERTLYEQLGDLYSLIVTTDHIERAYVRDAITADAYSTTVSKLIAQYKTLRESLGDQAPDLEAFGREYGISSRAGENRLRVGVPATVVYGDVGNSGSADSKKMEVSIFHAVQHFITMMDSLKLNMRAVDELHPTLTELVESVNKVPGLPADHESKTKTVGWLALLHTMKAHEEISDEQARQMSFDLDSAYAAFHRFVQGK